MGILDRLKKTRDEEEEDEDSADAEEESDDEDSGRGGLGGRLGRLRNIGGNAGGMLGKVLKRGSEDDDDGDEDDDEPVVAAAPAATAPAEPEVTAVEEEPLAPVLDDGDGAVETSAVEEPGAGSDEPTAVEDPPPAEKKGVGSGLSLGDMFEEKLQIDPGLRDLAMSQDDTTAQQLSDDLTEFLNLLEDMTPS